MIPRDVATIGIRIAAVYFGVQALVQIAALLSHTASAGGSLPGSLFGTPIALGLIATVLWLGAAGLGSSAAAGTSEPTGPPAPHPIEHLLGVGLILTGIVFAVGGVIDLIARLVSESATFGSDFASPVESEAMVIALAQIALAAGLIVWGRAKLASSPVAPESPAPPAL